VQKYQVILHISYLLFLDAWVSAPFVFVEFSYVVVVARTSIPGWVRAPFVLVPSDGVFGRFDLAALRGCHTLNVCLFVVFS
jgi:hypothetical protein